MQERVGAKVIQSYKSGFIGTCRSFPALPRCKRGRSMSKRQGRAGVVTGNQDRAAALVGRAERFSLGNILAVGRLGGWTRALSGALVAAVCAPAMAGPEGAHVVRGDVGISRDGVNTVIRAGRNSIIDYRSFNIGAGES